MTRGPSPRGRPAEAPDVPAHLVPAAEVRDFMARKAREKGGPRGTLRPGDAYAALLVLAAAAAIAGRFVHQAAAAGGAGALPVLTEERLAAFAPADGRWATAALALLVPALWYWALRAVGPLSVSRELLTWLFQAPVDRGPYLRRRVAVLRGLSAAWGLLGGALAVVPLVVGAGEGARTVNQAGGWDSTWGWTSPWVWAVGCVALAVALSFLALAAALRGQAARSGRAAGPVAGRRPLTGRRQLMGQRLVTDRRLLTGRHPVLDGARIEDLRRPELDAAAGAGQLLEYSLFALDAGALVRVLFAGRVPSGGRGPRGRRSSEGGADDVVRPLPRIAAGRPALLMVLTEWRQWRRCRGVVPGLALTWAVAALLAVSPLRLAPALLVVALVGVCLVAGRVASAGVAHSQGSPQRHAMWPLGRRAERLAQLAVPAGLAGGWMLLLGGGLGLASGHPLAAAAAVVSGVGLGAAGVASADAEPPEWGADVYLPTPGGLVPVKSILALARGLVLGALGALPAILAALGIIGPWAALAWAGVVAGASLGACLRRG